MRRSLCTIALVLFIAQPALAADNDGVWTEKQIKKYCYYKAKQNGDSASYFDTCMQNNEAKINRPKQSGQVAELNAADKRLKRLADKRVADEADDDAEKNAYTATPATPQ